MPEEKLTGGRVTSEVVKIGNTVHRSKNPNSEFVRSLLLFSEEKGLDCAPRFLGEDQQGREVFSFLPGEVPGDLGFFTDEQCRRAAEIISRLHKTLSAMPCCGKGQTLCHNDLSPCNFVFRGSVPYGVIDWDAASVGDPMDDLAYAVWLWLDIGNEDHDPREVGRRIRLMQAAYTKDAIDNCAFYTAMLRQMERVGRSVFPSREQTQATGAWARRCILWCETHLKLVLK